MAVMTRKAHMDPAVRQQSVNWWSLCPGRDLATQGHAPRDRRPQPPGPTHRLAGQRAARARGAHAGRALCTHVTCARPAGNRSRPRLAHGPHLGAAAVRAGLEVLSHREVGAPGPPSWLRGGLGGRSARLPRSGRGRPRASWAAQPTPVCRLAGSDTAALPRALAPGAAQGHHVTPFADGLTKNTASDLSRAPGRPVLPSRGAAPALLRLETRPRTIPLATFSNPGRPSGLFRSGPAVHLSSWGVRVGWEGKCTSHENFLGVREPPVGHADEGECGVAVQAWRPSGVH